MFLPFLKNPFATKKMSRQEFRELMQDHLNRLTSQNDGGRYTAQISALQPHYTTYLALLGSQDQNLGDQLGNTGAVQQVLADFKAFTRDELLVDVEYQFKRKKPNPAALTQFLPKGRKEYSNATYLTLPTLLQRLADLTQEYKAELGADLATKAAGLQAAFLTARNAQGEAKGDVQADSKEVKKLRKAAARQLKLNLLEQVKLHIDEPEAVKALYAAKWFSPSTAADKQ